jgi:hypothetical protein
MKYFYSGMIHPDEKGRGTLDPADCVLIQSLGDDERDDRLTS